MVDEPTPVTDSRLVGFNPEVEASHAETEQPLNLAATETAVDAPPAPPPLSFTHHCDNCGALHESAMDVCSVCGMANGVVKLGQAVK